jgi:hypothetical protein
MPGRCEDDAPTGATAVTAVHRGEPEAVLGGGGLVRLGDRAVVDPSVVRSGSRGAVDAR